MYILYITGHLKAPLLCFYFVARPEVTGYTVYVVTLSIYL